MHRPTSFCILHSAFCIALALAAASARADDFRAAIRARGAEVAESSLPTAISPGPYEFGLSLKNAADRALRGSLELHTAKADGGDGRCDAKADIDLPPPSVSDAAQPLVLKGELPNSYLGRNARIVVRIPGGEDIVCFSGAIAEDAGKVKKRAEAATKATSAAGGRHDIRYAERLPAGEGEMYRAFLEAGGVLIVRLVTCQEDYAGAAVFCGDNALPAFKPQKGPANPYDQNVAAGGTPLFDWPHRISPTLQAGNGRLSLPGEAGKKWETVQNGYSVLHRVGKGLLIVSTHTVADTKELREDISRQLKLEEDGMRFAGFGHDYGELETFRGRLQHIGIGGGKTTISVKNVDFARTNLNLAARLTVAEKRKGGRARTFLVRHKPSRKIGEVLKFEIAVPPLDLNGPCHFKAELLEWGGRKTWTFDEGDVALPEFLEIVPPGFRGLVSTARQQSDVLVGLKFNRKFFSAGGAAWKLVARDAKGAAAAEAEGVFTEGADSIEARLPVPRGAAPGDYALEAEVTFPDGSKAAASGNFGIVAPERGQIMVDQNGFLLKEGKPWFPLGIYHCHTFNWNEPIDDTGLRARDIGFDWMQLWGWDWDNHLSLDRKTLDPFIAKDIVGEAREKAVEALTETNRQTRAQLKEAGVVLAFEGFGFWNDIIVERPGEFGSFSFERNETAIGSKIRAIADDPDQLVGMWYLSDEAGGNFYRALGRAATLIRRHDTHLHPTFNLGNLPASLSGDYGGNDIYLRYYGGLSPAHDFAKRIDEMRREYAPLHRRPFVVPQAFGQSEKQPSETPEWVRLQAYVSVVHGASGIGFYCWKQTGDWSGANKQGMGWNPPTAHEVRKIIAEIRTFQDALRVPGAVFVKSRDGNVHALLCGDDASGRFLIAVNLQELPVRTDLDTPSLSGRTLEPLFGAPAAKVKNGLMPLSLPLWGTAVWRVK